MESMKHIEEEPKRRAMGLDIRSEFTVLSLGEVIKYQQSGTLKQVIVVCEVAEKYAQTLEVTWWGNDIDKLKGVEIGDYVDLKADVRGRDKNGRVYMSVVGRGIKIVKKATGAEQAFVRDVQANQARGGR